VDPDVVYVDDEIVDAMDNEEDDDFNTIAESDMDGQADIEDGHVLEEETLQNDSIA